ncbi:VOC family protein [Nocardioides sp. J2M5]|uniref:VOC family protein n=1 Tax=Nocardioides palaemonis TaxID=2829810 RepID=UPI001BA6DE7D|nr:VOC family protein [Nocardioides palaemonis]MBS2938264.1 VOC family protein [Nocardioides palaemonis]
MPGHAAIYVGDLDRMVAFYTRVLGLARVDDEPGFATMESDDWVLTLVRSPEAVPPSDPAPRRSDTAVKPVFAVTDLDATADVATALGAVADPVDARWTHRGEVRCDLVDPEGNVLGLRAPAP